MARPDDPNDFTIIHMKGSRDYAEWLRGLADHLDMSIPDMATLAFASLAAKQEYAPAPKRLKRTMRKVRK